MPAPKKTTAKKAKRTVKKAGQRRDANGRAIVRISKNTADVLEHPESIEDWDDEELLRGRRKDKNGHFTGAPPLMVPQAAHEELLKRRLNFARQHLAYNLKAALEALTDIITGDYAEPADKIKAINMVMDRVMGKAIDKVEISGEEAPWLQTLKIAITSEDSRDIVDAEVVED